jgi:hypothetical protein
MSCRLRVAFASICLVFICGTAAAQSPGDIINLFGGLVRSGVAVATQTAWQKIPFEETACIDQKLRQRGSSINLVVQQGIGPSDARVFDLRMACQNQSSLQPLRSGPSFDCAKASFADERAICSSPELSQLDRLVATSYIYVQDHLGEQAARSTRDRSLQIRHACSSDFACIKQAQISAINDYQKLGAPNVGGPSAPSPHPEYVVDGLSLGNRVVFDSASYREYQCRPSDQFSGFFFCQKRRPMQDPRGNYISSNTILHSEDGTAVYINRYLEPAFFDGDEARTDVEGRSKKFGRPARVIPMPAKSDVPNGMIVSWGDVVLEPLDATTMRSLADGDSVRAGFMIDHIGNLRHSASLGLPIYRLRGGAGYVWAASWNDSGIGTLQFLTIDASRFVPASTGGMIYTPPQSPTPTASTAIPMSDQAPPLVNPPSSAANAAPPDTPRATDAPSFTQQARQRIKENLDRIMSQRSSLPNEALKARLDLIASKLATANEQMDADALKNLLRECDAADSIFREATEFRQVSDVANRAVAIVKSRLETINFDAPLVHDIKAAVSSVDTAQAEGDLNSLKLALSALNESYDADKLNHLTEAKAQGFDTTESYDDFKDRQSKLGRSGIRLNGK